MVTHKSHEQWSPTNSDDSTVLGTLTESTTVCSFLLYNPTSSPLQTWPYKKNLLFWLDGECVFGHFDRGHHSIHVIFVVWEVDLPLRHLHADRLSPHGLPTNKVRVLVQELLEIWQSINTCKGITEEKKK